TVNFNIPIEPSPKVIASLLLIGGHPLFQPNLDYGSLRNCQIARRRGSWGRNIATNWHIRSCSRGRRRHNKLVILANSNRCTLWLVIDCGSVVLLSGFGGQVGSWLLRLSCSRR